MEFKEDVDYKLNFFRHLEYKPKVYLLTTDYGSFIFISSIQYSQLLNGEVKSQKLFNLLEEKGIIITSTNEERIVQSLKTRYSFLENGVSLHLVIPSNRCNLSCSYCFAMPDPMHADKKKTDMNEDIERKTIERIFEYSSHACTIEFTGGEPLVHFESVQRMALHAKELNKKYKKDLRLSIVTNLTLMNKSRAQWLVDEGFHICSSLDGNQTMNDSIRIIKGNNDKKIGTHASVVKWIKEINEMYSFNGINMRVGILPTITRNSFGKHKELIDEYVSLGSRIIDIRPLTLVGFASGSVDDALVYTKEEFFEFYSDCLKYVEELQNKGVDIKERMQELYSIKILKNEPTFHVDFESPYGGGINALAYHSNGNIYAAHEALEDEEFCLGNVFDDVSLSGLLSTPSVQSLIMNSALESNPICDSCVFKPYCGTNPIENRSEFGKVFFYPSKTTKHHETLFHTKRIFDKEYDKVKSNFIN